MSLILNEADWDELCQQAPQPQLNNLVLEDFEELWGVPKRLGEGYGRGMELLPGVWLSFSDEKYHQDFRIKAPVHNHPIQITIFLSGSFNCDIHSTFSRTRSYFSGSGISPAYVEEFKTGQHTVFVNVEIEPEVLESFFLADGQYRSAFGKQLFKGEDWKVSFYPTVTPEMRSLAHQIWNVSCWGAVKRIHLQAKVFELLALYLDLICEAPQQTKSAFKLKPKTLTALHHAKDILTTQFEHPPSLPELAQQVGINERTLRRGFRELFETTVIGYLTSLRMEQAERYLRERKLSISEVANLVGYSHLGNFSTAFKRQFGITPSQCLAGQKSLYI